jgi:AmiR/NasT family two-component response regulator
MRILIAEDEAIIRMDIKEMLSDVGYDVVGEARDGRQVLELAQSLKPDCILMDISMDGLDGIDATKSISNAGLAPVVMVTAFSQEKIVAEAVRAGAMAYVCKPFSQAEITSAIRVAVSRFEEMQTLAHEVDDLNERLETRKYVDRAKGVLMKNGLSEPEALSRLQKAAMNSRKTLREVAEAVLLADGLTI